MVALGGGRARPARDPSQQADFPFIQGVYHADAQRVPDGEIRSEWCTAVADASPTWPRRSSWVSTAASATTGRSASGGARGGGIELSVEAFLGGAVLGPGQRRVLHGVSWAEADARSEGGHGDGGGGDVPTLLAQWAGRVGRAGGARAESPFQVGWCSWYHYFDAVTEDDLRTNLARAADWPFEVFQLDDGYQAGIGDWRATNAKFPSDLETLAAAITAAETPTRTLAGPFLGGSRLGGGARPPGMDRPRPAVRWRRRSRHGA